MFLPIAHAATTNAKCVAQGFLDKFNDAVLFPAIILLSGVALLMFLWGAFQFIRKANDPGARNDGKNHMIYGVIGLLVMVSAATILAIAANTFGLSSDPADCGYDPRLSPLDPEVRTFPTLSL